MDETRLGHYQLLRCLGEGGMGRVYLARDTQLERDVAVKVLAPELAGDRSLMARFRVEAIAQARLSHPNIVPIYTFGREAGAYVIVMEYVAGRTLKQLIRDEGKLGPDRALRIAASVLDALAFAHARGVLHRDIKPANIFVSDDGTVKVGDFGIAKVEGLDGLTRVGTVLGTPHYSSPEQIRALKATPATDVYALSVTLFEMLTGVLPFGASGGSDLDVLTGHLEQVPPAPSSLCPGLPSGLDAVIARGLAKKPEDRYRSAAEYRQAIDAVLQARETPLPDFDRILQPLAQVPGRIRARLGRPSFELRQIPVRANTWWLLLLLIPLLLLLLALTVRCASDGPAAQAGEVPARLCALAPIGGLGRAAGFQASIMS